MVQGVELFEYDAYAAQTAQLAQAFDGLAIRALTAGNIAAVSSDRGIYQLFESGNLVYMKTCPIGMREMLHIHLDSFQIQRNEEFSSAGFKALIIERDWIANFDISALVARYRKLGYDSDWND